MEVGRFRASTASYIRIHFVDADERVARTNEWLGSQKYMAPEQLSEFHNTKCVADIYSFGCILHDLATSGSRTPFQQHTASGPLGAIIEKCTAVDQSRRFQKIANIRAALVHALSRGVATVPDASTIEWEDELKVIDAWDVEKARNFARYIQGTSDRSILKALDEERMQKLAKIDEDAWSELARIYCDWAAVGGFDYAYCDVIIGLLEKVFELGCLP